jgi:hypothetical protein
MRGTGSPYMDKGRPWAFSKKPSAQESWQTAQFEHKPAKNIDRAVNRTLSFKRTLIQSVPAKQSQVS